MGNSAGATIAYYAGLRAAAEVEDLEPLQIRGLILRQAFFGGIQRTGSELRLANDPVIPLCVIDLLWELALPIGADRDHEYANPTAGNGSKTLDKMGALGWRVMVSGCKGDPLVDREIAEAKLMTERGVQVVCDIEEEGHHEIEYAQPSKAKELTGVIKDFISQ
ncbi:hypothetical protein L6164_006147 [Bauhinia variegata]|uniref:Uncharacterized protein n=1 Tax=Bauhinia variegata TaxID=167791 RepID=A0ACB9PSZ0_BAUVA|nr:hypothetical protein L6164_006147 [Bauhinia variegata]